MQLRRHDHADQLHRQRQLRQPTAAAACATTGGTTTLTNCTVSGNSASYDGGGLYNYGGTTTLTNCTVSGNSASGNGGGLYNDYGGTTTLTNCTVSGNSAGTTAAACTTPRRHDHADQLHRQRQLRQRRRRRPVQRLDGTTTLTNCTVSGNSATGSAAAACAHRHDGTTTLTNCTVSGNSASGNGGGLYISYGGTTTLTNCTVSGNSASGNGGGVYSTELRGTTTLTNCTVSGNSAGTTAAACDNAGRHGDPRQHHRGGEHGHHRGPDALGTFASQGNNLIGETDGSSGWVGSDLTGTIAQPLDPVLAPLGDYGGPTQTMALLLNSPAIDAGNNALIPAGVTTDQRGFARIVNGTVDIGAFETNGIIVKGNVYNDQDGNGFRGSSESGLAGWTVNLRDSSGSVLGSVLTDANGNYKFAGVGLGSSYQVAEVVPADWVQTQPLYPTVFSFTAQSGHNLNGLNFGDHSAPALDASAAIDNGQAGYSETGSWYGVVGGLGGNNRVARTVQRGKATATATWDFTGLSSSNTYDVYVTFGSKSQYSTAAPYTVYDGTTSLGTQFLNESIPVTMAQGGRAQGNYGGVGWLELGTYAITGTELKVVLSNLTSGSYVDADGVLLVRHGTGAPSHPSGASPSSTSSTTDRTLALGAVDFKTTSTPSSTSKTGQNGARTVVLRGVSAPGPIHVVYNPGSRPAVNQSTTDAIDAFLGLGRDDGTFSGTNDQVIALAEDQLFGKKMA